MKETGEVYYYIIEGETPAKKNSRKFTKTGMSYLTKNFTGWHSDAYVQVMKQKRPAAPIEKPCSFRFIFNHADLKRRDSDNQVSSIMDLLHDTQIISDDNWKIAREINIVNDLCKNHAFCCLEIKVMSESYLEKLKTFIFEEINRFKQHFNTCYN